MVSITQKEMKGVPLEHYGHNGTRGKGCRKNMFCSKDTADFTSISELSITWQSLCPAYNRCIVDKEQEHGSPLRQPNSGNHASLPKIQSGLLKPTKSLPWLALIFLRQLDPWIGKFITTENLKISLLPKIVLDIYRKLTIPAEPSQIPMLYSIEFSLWGWASREKSTDI